MGSSPNATLIRGFLINRELLRDHYQVTKTAKEKADENLEQNSGYDIDDSMIEEFMEMRVENDIENTKEYSFYTAGSCDWSGDDNKMYFGICLAHSDINTLEDLPSVPTFDFQVSTEEREHFYNYVENKLGQDRESIDYEVYMLPYYG